MLVWRCFYVACNSVITSSHGVAAPVRVQLIKSFCLPLLVYCIRALSLKRSAVHMLSVCWNDAYRCIFNYKRSESVRILQVSFGTFDFRHLYDLHRWRFLQTIGCKSTYWVDLVKITDLQYHIGVDLADAYLRDNRSASFTNAVYIHCRELL